MAAYGHTEVNAECPLLLLPFRRHPFGVEDEVMEILWQDGEAVLQRHNQRNPNEQAPWVDEDDPLKSLDLLSGVPTPHLAEPNTVPDVEEAFPFPIQLPPPEAAVSDGEQGFATDSSVMTLQVSSGSSSQIGIEANKSSVGSESIVAPVNPRSSSIEKELTEPERTSFRASASNHNERKKRKIKDLKEFEKSPSQDSQMEAPRGENRAPQKSTRWGRVAEVHNLSERRRRHRITKKMRTLQKLIPDSHKLDKASLLDDTIHYIKSLQSQLQWWMGSGIAQMRVLQQLCHAGIEMRPPTLPSMEDFMHPSKFPLVGLLPPPLMGHGYMPNPFSYRNQMQMPPEQNPEHTAVHFVPNAQPVNAFSFSSYAAQANQVKPQPPTGHNQMKQ